MYSFSFDKPAGLMVGVLKVKPYFNEDEDYAILLDSIAQNETATRPGDPFKFILVIDPAIPMPNATWRRRFAKSRGKSPYPFLFVTVTPSQLLRGVLTMVNWVSPPAPGSGTVAVASFDEAVAWLEEKSNRKLPIVKKLLEEATKGLK